MNWLLTKAGRYATATALLAANVSGMMYLALAGIGHLKYSGKRRIILHLFKRYMYNAGVRAAYVNAFVGVLVGWVMIVAANNLLPKGVALSQYFQSFYVLVSIDEVGPLVSGLILISRSANAVTADVSYLKLNGEFEALHAQRINPYVLFLMPIFFAFPLSLILMFFLFNVVCVLSSYIMLALTAGDGIPLGLFISGILDQISGLGLFITITKALLGGSVIGIISIYFGSTVQGGYDAVSRAISNSTTVQIFAFLALNLALSYLAYR